MSFRTAVIGDIHGNFGAVSSLFSIVRPLVDRLIFVGDYVNRGSHSREVMQFLVEKKRADQSLIFLRGNHDRAFLDCLARGQLVPFLRIGGAKTIRSYVRSPHGDVLAQLRLEVPSEHVDFWSSFKSHSRTQRYSSRMSHNPSGHRRPLGCMGIRCYPRPDPTSQITSQLSTPGVEHCRLAD